MGIQVPSIVGRGNAYETLKQGFSLVLLAGRHGTPGKRTS